MLASCETTKRPAPSSIPTADEQFNCGPAVPPLPEDELLIAWDSKDMQGYAVDAWLWGERCAVANMLNKEYFGCVINEDKAACIRFDNLLAVIRERSKTLDTQ